MSRPRIALTLGDPAGIGPELVARLLAEADVMGEVDATVIGPRWAMDRARELVPSAGERPPVFTQDVACPDAAEPPCGTPGADSGAWAMAALNAAAHLAEAGEVDAIVTAPVSKNAIQAAGHTDFIGHTEFFGARVNVPEPTMFFWSPRMCVTLVTVHCALRDVPERMTAERITTSIDRTVAALRRLDMRRPRLAVCGLNPHAGEDGLFGHEDADIIAPAIAAYPARKCTVTGPLAADTAFMRTGRGEFDAVVAMYHDQGLAPFKLVAFDTGVNVTLGLPYVRTSVDHGTAFDIAGKGTADPSSLKAAMHLAARLVHATRHTS